VDFGSMDGEPVHVLTLLLGAPREPRAFLLAGQIISRRLADERFRNRLRGACTREQVIALVEEADRSGLD
jgi:mannitol/fructose-specific phosphotransferase system IIA component (Ntr-type)